MVTSKIRNPCEFLLMSICLVGLTQGYLQFSSRILKITEKIFFDPALEKIYTNLAHDSRVKKIRPIFIPSSICEGALRKRRKGRKSEGENGRIVRE